MAMNPYRMQGEMEGLSEEQLMSVEAPSFMKIAELQRRKDMRERMAEPPPSTVMEDLMGQNIQPQERLSGREGYAAGGIVAPQPNPPFSWYGNWPFNPEEEADDPRYQRWLKNLFRSAAAQAGRGADMLLPGFALGRESIPAIKRFFEYATEVPGEPGGMPGAVLDANPHLAGGSDIPPSPTSTYMPPTPTPQEVMGPPAPTMEQMVRAQLDAPAADGGLPPWMEDFKKQLPGAIDYSSYMDRREDLARKGLEQNKWLALANMGFGMMASDSPFAAGAMGEGGLTGMTSYGKGLADYNTALDAVIKDSMAGQQWNAENARANVNAQVNMMNAQAGMEGGEESRKLERLRAILEARKADQAEEWNRARIKKLESGTGGGGITPKDLESAARELALAMVGPDDGTPEWKVAFAQKWREQLERMLNMYGIRGGASLLDDGGRGDDVDYDVRQ